MSQSEETDGGRTRVHPSATSTASVDLLTTLLIFGGACGLGLWLALSGSHGVIGTVLAVLGAGAVLHETWKWTRMRPLRTRLGAIVLSVDPWPARIGEVLDVRFIQRVRSGIQVQTITLRLLCEGARKETYGIRDREQKVWSNAVDLPSVVLRDVAFEADDVLTAGTRITIPVGAFGSSDWTRWFVVVEATIAGCPEYEATFPLEVLRADDADEAQRA